MHKSLIDSCIFIHKLNDGSEILSLSLTCSNCQDSLNISSEVLKEIEPGVTMEEGDRCSAISLLNIVQNAIQLKHINLISLTSDKRILDKFNLLRDSYYGWMKRPDYLKKMVASGRLTEAEIHTKGFRYKDYGECSLIAIAMMSPNDHTIVTEDHGRVYKHPDKNIFQDYAIPHGIAVLSYSEWTSKIGHIGNIFD